MFIFSYTFRYFVYLSPNISISCACIVFQLCIGFFHFSFNSFKEVYCIISYLLEYKIKETNTIITCGFPINSIKKVQSMLEKNNINYLILNKRCGYEIEEKIEFNNKNTYIKQYKISKTYVNNIKKIDNIYDYLKKNMKKQNIKTILEEVEKVIDETRKI